MPTQTQNKLKNGELFHQPICCGGDPDEACGYPPKTVRAIISISIVLLSFTTFVFLAIFLALKEQYTEAMGISGIISSVLSGVIGYYFGSKQPKPPHELIPTNPVQPPKGEELDSIYDDGLDYS